MIAAASFVVSLSSSVSAWPATFETLKGMSSMDGQPVP
jgi:hypothetical protein